MQAPEALNLCKLIHAPNEVEGKTMTVIGQLVGGDTVTGAFHLRFPDSPDIKGHLSRKFSYLGELTLDRNYTAVLLKQGRFITRPIGTHDVRTS